MTHIWRSVPAESWKEREIFQDDTEQARQEQNLALIGQLAGGIAHDFNNLLTAMAFNLEKVKGTLPRVPELCPPIQALDELFARATKTTRQLLTFAQRRTLEAEPQEINGLLGHSLEVLGRLLGDSVEICYHPDTEDHWALVDSAMVDQAVLNLCLNARDAMPRGGELVIRTRRHVPTERERARWTLVPGDFIEVQFSDSGTGIAPEHLPRIFEPFFTTKEPGKGTGLGLASVYGGARQHGGWVDVDSTWGKGTTFSIFLPRLKGADSATR